jgi:anti-anti-sigma factor
LPGVTKPYRATRCAIYRDGAVLRLVGDIDVGNSAGVGRRVAAEVGAGVATLDLTEVHYFGSAGVRVVLTGFGARSSGGTLEVRCAPAVFRVMRISGLVGTDGLVVTRGGTGR